MPRFEEIKVGDTAVVVHAITEKDIQRFVDLTGDDNRIHVDKEYASHTPLKKPVVHGMLGASFISTLIGTKLPGDGALWFSQSLEFLFPVRVGDVLTVRAEVLKKHDGERTLEIRTDIYNQDNQKVTAGTAKVKVYEEEVPKDAPPASAEQTQETALVIGGSGGIGEASVLALAGAGFDVAFTYLKNEEKAAQIKEKVEAIGRKCVVCRADVADEGQVKALAQTVERKFGGLTAIVFSATGKAPAIKFGALEWGEMQRHFNVHVKGTFNVLKAFVPMMESRKYGKIVCVTSMYIEYPSTDLAPYITAKSALNGFSKALALELAPKGIRVNMVSPGMTETDLVAAVPQKAKMLIEARTPLQRLSQPSDVANAICFLASPQSDFLTGETIRVNGGQTMI
ncbi:MAG: SDR family oxidoreductase [Nitrospinae bacterium]|nr:SDR family oxidoreductase [Nitrospinota bacterium]